MFSKGTPLGSCQTLLLPTVVWYTVYRICDFRTSKSSSYRQDTKLIFDVRSWYLTER
jgi:hypothetical protein